MTGCGDSKLVVREKGGRTHGGHHGRDFEVLDLATGQLQHLGRVIAEQGTGAQRAPHPPHHHCRTEAMASNITSHNPKLTRWDGEGIEPIAADELFGCEVTE
jgi:hypothetical protein